MNQILREIASYGVLPVVNVTNPDWSNPLCDALVAGGLPAIEVTLRSDNSFESLKRIAADDRLLVGAGTVTSLEQLDRALGCGAKFIVCPGYSQKLVDACNRLNVPIVPGCSDAGTVQAAQDSGLELVKFFPAEQLGGIAMLKALRGPFVNMQFMPTGGVNFDNLEAYLSQPFVAACGGTFLANADTLKKEDFAAVTQNCRRAVRTSLGFRLAHIGINHSSAMEATAAANRFALLFNMDTDPRGRCTFAGTAVENMNTPFYGRNGHIGFSTLSMERALAWLERIGAKINPESVTKDAKGKITCVYLAEEIGGFAMHIVERK